MARDVRWAGNIRDAKKTTDFDVLGWHFLHVLEFMRSDDGEKENW